MANRNEERRTSTVLSGAGVLFFALLATFAGCVTDGARSSRPVLDLAKLDGWVIVAPAGSIPSEAYAAAEFQRLYAQASGTTLPIVPVAGPKAVGCILIGPQAAATARTCRIGSATLGAEDLRIVVHRREIVITGGRPRGTLYGVYTFVEDYLGIRFLTAEHTYVPRLDAPRPLPAIDRSYSPPIPWRYAYYGEIHADHAFAARLRQNAVPNEEKFGGLSTNRLINHSVSGLLPWTQYGAEHPEYFCLRDGKRPAQLLNHQTYEIQPCFSSPEARRIMLENLRVQIKREYPQWKDYSVSQDDNHRYCTCPGCAALDAAAGAHTGQLLDFVNWTAGEVRKDYPDVTIGTLIYQWTRTPPKNMKPAANVKLQLCSIECCQIHPIDDATCPLNKSFQEDLTGWAALSDNIAIWNYNVNFRSYQLPCPNLFNLERNVRYFSQNHARGIFMQAAAGTTGAEFSDLRNYMICNLLWDPSRSGDALMEEFLRLHYGPAAPPIRRFIERIHAAARESGKHRNCFGTGERYGLTPELGRRGIEDFKEALALAPDDAIRTRVEKASLAAWRLAMEPAVVALTDGKPLDARQKAELRPVLETFLALCHKQGIVLVTEDTRLDDAEKALRALLADSAAAQLSGLPTDPLATALQKLLDLVQKPGDAVALAVEAKLERPGAAAETWRGQFQRLAADAFHLEFAGEKSAGAVQVAPGAGFVHVPLPASLFVRTGQLPPEGKPLTLSVLERLLLAAEPEAAPHIQMAKTLNGPTLVAMLPVFGLRVTPGKVAAGGQEFAVDLPGNGGCLLFDVDLANSTIRRLVFTSLALNVDCRLTFSRPTALPPVPASVPKTLQIPVAEFNGTLEKVMGDLITGWIKGRHLTVEQKAAAGSLEGTIYSALGSGSPR